MLCQLPKDLLIFNYHQKEQLDYHSEIKSQLIERMLKCFEHAVCDFYPANEASGINAYSRKIHQENLKHQVAKVSQLILEAAMQVGDMVDIKCLFGMLCPPASSIMIDDESFNIDAELNSLYGQGDSKKGMELRAKFQYICDLYKSVI